MSAVTTPDMLISTPFGPFPYAFARHITRRYWDGVQPNHRTALVINSREISYDKPTHELLKQHGFKHHGRKWFRIDDSTSIKGTAP
jgi:hypothetical protein